MQACPVLRCCATHHCCFCNFVRSVPQAGKYLIQVEYAAGVVHDNIVQLLDVFVEGEQYVIVVSLGRAAPLYDYADHWA